MKKIYLSIVSLLVWQPCQYFYTKEKKHTSYETSQRTGRPARKNSLHTFLGLGLTATAIGVVIKVLSSQQHPDEEAISPIPTPVDDPTAHNNQTDATVTTTIADPPVDSTSSDLDNLYTIPNANNVFRGPNNNTQQDIDVILSNDSDTSPIAEPPLPFDALYQGEDIDLVKNLYEIYKDVDLKSSERLGSGKYGSVYKLGELYAVKTYMEEDKDVNAQEEYEKCKKLNLEHVLGILTIQGKKCLLMNKLEKKDWSVGKMSRKEYIQSCMDLLENRASWPAGTEHEDVRPCNIMHDQNDKACFIDPFVGDVGLGVEGSDLFETLFKLRFFEENKAKYEANLEKIKNIGMVCKDEEQIDIREIDYSFLSFELMGEDIIDVKTTVGNFTPYNYFITLAKCKRSVVSRTNAFHIIIDALVIELWLKEFDKIKAENYEDLSKKTKDLIEKILLEYAEEELKYQKEDYDQDKTQAAVRILTNKKEDLGARGIILACTLKIAFKELENSLGKEYKVNLDDYGPKKKLDLLEGKLVATYSKAHPEVALLYKATRDEDYSYNQCIEDLKKILETLG